VTGRDPDLIVTVAGRMALALGTASSRIRIAATMADPLKWGFVKSLARPEGNITGVSVDAGLEVRGKRLQILKDAIHRSARSLSLLRPRNGRDLPVRYCATPPSAWESS
jgi:ABC-type uncharacterized transport system substrate-binding protein